MIKDVSKTIKNKAKEQKVRFFSVLLATLGASLFENIFTGKDTIRKREGSVTAGEGTVRAGQNF